MAILGLNNYTQKAASLTGDFLGDVLQIGDSDYPMYDAFYNAILADANNTLPEASHWVGFFSMPMPDSDSEDEDLKSLKERFMDKAGDMRQAASDAIGGLNVLKVQKTTPNTWLAGSINPLNIGLDPHKWTLGDKTYNMANQFTAGLGHAVMFITGVDLPEDGFDINRPSASYNVGGFTKGIVGAPRKDFANLKITFLENNSSLVDLVIKPWMIHSSYASLKFAKSANFTLFNLVRSPSGFRIRKRVEFYHVVPISIDGEAYTYSAGTDYTKRQTQFVFSDYTIDEGAQLEDSMLDSVKNWAKRLLVRSVTAVVEDRVDLAIGSGERVLTNVTGALVKQVRDVVVDTQSRVREYVQHVEETLIETMVPEDGRIDRGAPGMLTGVPNAIGTTPVTIPVDDNIPLDPLPISDITTRNNVEYSILHTDRNDTPDSSALPLSQVQINPDDTSLGINVSEVRVNADDTPDSSQGVPSVGVPIKSNDTPVSLTGVPSTLVEIDSNDTPNPLNIKFDEVNIGRNDTSKPSALGVSNVEITSDDTVTKKSKINTTIINVSENDTPNTSSIRGNNIEVPKD